MRNGNSSGEFRGGLFALGLALGRLGAKASEESASRSCQAVLHCERDALLDNHKYEREDMWRGKRTVVFCALSVQCAKHQEMSEVRAQMVWLNRLFFVANFLMFVALGWLWARGGSAALVQGTWEYKDLVSVLLTVVTVVLAFIGAIIGLAAIWGFNTIQDVARGKAENIASESCKTYLKSKEFSSILHDAVFAKLQQEARNAVQDALAPAVVLANDAPEFSLQNDVNGRKEASQPKAEDRPWQD